MKINKLELRNFGKFRDQSVQLQDGLNVLYAPNETGKSTLAGFIRYMLYGFPKNERSSTTNPVTTAQHYKPWQGGEVGGSLTFTADGRTVTVVRDGAKDVRMYDALTGADIPMLREIGEELYGISLETFESSAFFGQSSLQQVNIAQLEDKLKNIVTGADEDVSYEKAKDALNKAKNKIDSGRAGALPQLRREMAELSYHLEQVRQEQAALQDMMQECETFTLRLSQSRAERMQIDEKIAQQGARIEQEFTQKKKALLLQSQECQMRVEQLQSRLGGQTRTQVDDLNRQAQRLLALRDMLEWQSPPQCPRKNVGWLIGGLVLLAAAAVGAWFSVWAALAAVPGLVGVIVYAVGTAKQKREYQQQMSAYEKEQLRHTQAKQLQVTLSARLGEQSDYTAAISALYDDLATLAEEQVLAQRLQSDIDALDIQTHRQTDTDYRALQYQKEQILRAEQELQVALAEKKAQCQERSRHIESVDLLKSQLNEKQERVETLEKRLSSYRLAMEALDEAHRKMTYLYAPLLAEKTADFFSTMTGDDTRRVTVEVGGKVRIEEKDIVRQLPYYSVGTADAVYISLRLALIDMIYTKQKPTLVFDDSFSNFDEKRLKEMLSLLGNLSKKTQILYFTCRDPKDLLSDIEYHNIEL